MNKRIRELAVRADKIVKSQHPNADMNTGVVIMMDVFAELIVKECAQFCEDKNSKLLGTMIKEHFGVES